MELKAKEEQEKWNLKNIFYANMIKTKGPHGIILPSFPQYFCPEDE